jgi:hypothetical protein
MYSYNNAFEKELKKIVSEEIERLSGHLSLGAATDFSDYRYHVGKIAALREIEGYCDEVNSKLAQY